MQGSAHVNGLSPRRAVRVCGGASRLIRGHAAKPFEICSTQHHEGGARPHKARPLRRSGRSSSGHCRACRQPEALASAALRAHAAQLLPTVFTTCMTWLGSPCSSCAATGSRSANVSVRRSALLWIVKAWNRLSLRHGSKGYRVRVGDGSGAEQTSEDNVRGLRHM
jgi:hypothetical protein